MNILLLWYRDKKRLVERMMQSMPCCAGFSKMWMHTVLKWDVTFKKMTNSKMGVVILIDQKIQIQCALWDSNWNILWNIASKMHFMRVNISGVTIVMHKCSKFLLLIQVERKRLDNLISTFLMWLDSNCCNLLLCFIFVKINAWSSRMASSCLIGWWDQNSWVYIRPSLRHHKI